jgi:hypothetical protein
LTALLDIQELSPDPVQRTEIPFGEWLPDLQRLNNPGAVEALNVIPTEGGYVPFKAHTPDNNKTMTNPVHGAAAVLDDNDLVQLFAGSGGGVFTSLQGTHNFVQIFGTSVGAKNAWKFIRVNDQMVAIHPQAFPQRTPVGTTTAMVAVGGSPPKAECGAQVGDFLMLGNLKTDPDDGNGFRPYRVRWSGFNNLDLPWVSDPITQADFQDMPPAGGSVRAISGREYGTIFQERTISRATYRGPPEVFDIVQVEDRRGCIARDSIVDVGAVQFGLAEDGFFIWNGTNTELVGTNKVNRYFFSRLQYSLRSRIAGAADFENGCVQWAFPTDRGCLQNEIIEPIVWSDEVAQEIDGQCPIIDDARYMRFRVNLPDGTSWRHANGVEIARKPTGVF